MIFLVGFMDWTSDIWKLK